MDESGLKIISCVDGKTSIKDIISMTQLGSFEALKTIYALLSVRTVELKEERAALNEIPEDVAKEIHKENREAIEPMTQEMIEDMLRKCERLGQETSRLFFLLRISRETQDTRNRSRSMEISNRTDALWKWNSKLEKCCLGPQRGSTLSVPAFFSSL